MKPGYIQVILLLFIISILTIIGQLFIYESKDNIHLNNASKIIMEIKHLDLELNEKVLLISAFKSIHYDDIVKSTNQIKSTLTKLDISTIPYPSNSIKIAIKKLIDQLRVSLKIKVSQTEDLKSQAATARNSSIYLLQEINKPILKEHSEFADIAASTFIEIQGFQIFPINEKRINTEQKLQTFREKLEPAVNNAYYKNIIAHMEKSFQATIKMTEIQTALFNQNNQQRIEELISLLNNIHLKREYQATQNQYILMIIALVFLIALGFTVSRWSKANRKKNQSFQLFVDAVEAISEGFAFFDNQRKLVYCNATFETIYHQLGEKLQPGMTLDAFIQLKTDARITQHRTEISEDIYLDYFNDGRWVYCLNNNTAQNGTALVRIDLTEQKKIEAELMKLSQAVEQSSASVVITDTEGIIEYVNPKFEEITGYSRNEAMGKNPRILSSGEKSKADHKELWQTILSGKDWQGEFHNRRKDGSLFWEWAKISPIKNEDGKVISILAINEDITERKKLEEQVRWSQKMDAVGQLTGGIAHDFNNILGIILGNLSLIKTKISNDPWINKRVDEAMKGANRGTSITRKLLSFSRKDSSNLETSSINNLILNMKELIEKSLTATIHVETKLESDLWPVAINKGDFEDVIINLSLNARDAMPDGGKLTIETANKHLTKQYLDKIEQPETDNFIMVSVSDSGKGMSEKIISKAIEPFFTTKRSGKGTGLGLSQVYGFVQRCHGLMKIHSSEGTGSTIQLFFPRSEQNIKNSHEKVALSEIPTGSETILIVDDEEALLEITSSLLNSAGYKTITATSGKQASSILKSGEKIDLLFSDIIMPGEYDGFQLASKIHQEYPHLKILLTSGYTMERENQIISDDLFIASLTESIVNKPYDQSELTQAIRTT
ncbi:MAG: PAS domain S-box protein, partial [Gammaproteobacteria bacterium]|nr:PAS domain S-box protein [Gammaproteobacteria bacterium]